MEPNVELVRSIFARWERGDWSDAGWADPRIEFAIADGPDQRTIHGTAALAEAWREFLTAWDDYATTGEEFHDLGDGRVLVLLRASGRGKTSGALIGTAGHSACVFTVDDGAVTRLAIYFDRRNALAELGLAG
jgi:ketosteroid isomerase-like protein